MTGESNPTSTGEFGIVANVLWSQPDRLFRIGAKCWLTRGTGGEGWYRFVWRGCSLSGRPIEKWAPTERFHNFRAAWIPPKLQGKVQYLRGTRQEMEKLAADLSVFADQLRADRYPDRYPDPYI